MRYEIKVVNQRKNDKKTYPKKCIVAVVVFITKKVGIGIKNAESR